MSSSKVCKILDEIARDEQYERLKSGLKKEFISEGIDISGTVYKRILGGVLDVLVTLEELEGDVKLNNECLILIEDIATNGKCRYPWKVVKMLIVVVYFNLFEELIQENKNIKPEESIKTENSEENPVSLSMSDSLLSFSFEDNPNSTLENTLSDPTEDDLENNNKSEENSTGSKGGEVLFSLTSAFSGLRKIVSFEKNKSRDSLESEKTKDPEESEKEFRQLKNESVSYILSFDLPPFTLQRLCEIPLNQPYRAFRKLFNAYRKLFAVRSIEYEPVVLPSFLDLTEFTQLDQVYLNLSNWEKKYLTPSDTEWDEDLRWENSDDQDSSDERPFKRPLE